MKPIQLDFLGVYTPAGRSRRQLRFRFRSNDYNMCAITVEPADGMATDDIQGTEGKVEATFDDLSATATRCRVGEALEFEGGTETPAFVDELELKRTLLDGGGDFPLPEGSRPYARWVTSGSRFVARLADGDGVRFENSGLRFVLGLDRKKTEAARPGSGHAVDEYTLRPNVTIEGSGANFVVSDTLRLAREWRPRVGRVCSVLAFYSRASVEWLGEEVGFRRANGETTWLRRTYRFRRVLSVPQARVTEGRGKGVVTRVRRELWDEAERLGEWSEHIRSAVDFYVSSFVLTAQSEFFALTTALEATKEGFLARGEVEGTVEVERWKALGKSLKEAIRSAVPEGEARRNMYEKLPELIRWSYGRVVMEMVKELAIDIDDIYPNGLSFLKIRNEMIHGGRTPAAGELELEVARLRALVERAIGRILGGQSARIGGNGVVARAEDGVAG